MGMGRRITGSLVGIGLMLGSVSAAEARPRWDRGDWHHRRDRGGFGFGDAVGVAALVGAVAIVASSMSKDRNARQDNARYDGTPPAEAEGYRNDQSDDGYGRDEDFGNTDQTQGDDDQMADACATAARDEAQRRDGGYAEVRTMEDARPVDGGFDMDGQVESRASYRATNGTTRRFTCSVRDGRVAQVYLSRDVVMR